MQPMSALIAPSASYVRASVDENASVLTDVLRIIDVGATARRQDMQKSGEDDGDLGAPDADVYQGRGARRRTV
eukprot:883329-Pyramimonas_sp.AAC.1